MTESEKFIIEGMYKTALNAYLDRKYEAKKADETNHIGMIKVAQHNLGYEEGAAIAYAVLLNKDLKAFRQDIADMEEERCLTELANSLRM